VGYKFNIFIEEPYVRAEASFRGAHKNLKNLTNIPDLSKVIVDLRMVCRSLSDTERFYYATELANILKKVQVALIMYEPLFEMENTGGAIPDNLHAVKTLDEAYKWLDSAESTGGMN